jgi:FMN phosphatase YigB (HAD superfamily)
MVKNIIFDLGGVILDIDYKRTISAFEKLGMKNAGELYSKAKQNPIFDQLEKGLITEEQFYDGLRRMSGLQIQDTQLRDAWNALLVDLPEKNVALLQKLRPDYRLYLLSNTNAIHEKGYHEMIVKKYGCFILNDLFDNRYLSHHIHLRKPDKEIFEYVLSDADIKAEETLFIDDSPQHIEAAKKLGIDAVHLDGFDVCQLLDSIL